MASRSSPSNLHVTLLKELFEAHVGPLREDVRALRNDLRIGVDAVRADTAIASQKADAAHKRLDDLESQYRGIKWFIRLIVSAIATIGACVGIWFKVH